MEKLNEFIIKQLNDNKVQRWIIKATDLFALCNNMGILDDDELMIDIIEYLEISHFGLAKTWSTLRAEHKKWASQVPRGSKRDFKFFLRNEYGAKFDSKTIAGAVKSLDKIHSDLVSLVGHVRIHANLV